MPKIRRSVIRARYLIRNGFGLTSLQPLDISVILTTASWNARTSPNSALIARRELDELARSTRLFPVFQEEHDGQYGATAGAGMGCAFGWLPRSFCRWGSLTGSVRGPRRRDAGCGSSMGLAFFVSGHGRQLALLLMFLALKLVR